MKKISLFIVASFACTTMMFAQTQTFLQLKNGQKYQVDSKMETTSSTEMQGQTIDTKANISTTYQIVVDGSDGNQYNLTNTISHLVMNMTMMGQEINFDSDKKEDLDGQVGQGLKPFINNPKKVKIDNHGEFTDVSDSGSEAESQIAKQLRLGANGYGAQLAFLAVPKNAKAGTTWTVKKDQDGIATTTNYTVKEVNGNIATIAFDGTVTSDIKMEQHGMEISTKTTGKFNGTEKVDITSGVIQSSQTAADASGTVSAMGHDFPTSSKVTSTTTLKQL